MSAADVVASYLEEQEIPYSRNDATFTFALSGEHKKSMPAVITVRERTLSFQAFFIRRPIDNAGEVYRMLLARNLRSLPVRFAADADGDVYLAGELERDRADASALDVLFGAMVFVADEMFPHALELGFASYLEADRAYRATHTPENAPRKNF